VSNFVYVKDTDGDVCLVNTEQIHYIFRDHMKDLYRVRFGYNDVYDTSGITTRYACDDLIIDPATYEKLVAHLQAKHGEIPQLF